MAFWNGNKSGHQHDKDSKYACNERCRKIKETRPTNAPRRIGLYVHDLDNEEFSSVEQKLELRLLDIRYVLKASHSLIDPNLHVSLLFMRFIRSGGRQEIVWYCCMCGDGPIGDWSNHCYQCSHTRCDGCQLYEH
jgi:hypothetical protein